MNKSLWQTISSFEFIHSPHKWLPTTLSCGKHGSALSIESIPRLIFCLRPWALKINFGCIFGSRTFVPTSWMCKKQTSVSHSSRESEIVSLDAGLRMDGRPALDGRDVVIEVLRSSKSTESPTHGAAANCSRDHKSKLKQKGNRDVDQQLADMLTKGSFTRDEWDHLFRLLKIMNFSILLAAIFFQTESRVSCLRELRKVRLKKVRRWWNRDRWIWCQGTSWAQREPFRKIRVLRTAQGIKNWIRVVIHRALGNECETTAKTQQHILKSDKMTLHLRVPGEWWILQAQRAPGNWCEVMTVKPKGQSWNSTSCRSPTLEKVFKNLRQKLNLTEEAPVFDNDESLCSSWTNLHWKFGSIQEHQLRRAQEFVRYHSEIDIGTWSRNSEFITDWLDSSLMDEIYTYARSSNQVEESKSTRPLRFRLLLGEDARAFRSERKMECSARSISTVQFFQRIAWNWWTWDISKKLDTQYSRASVLWVVKFWTERITEMPYTSMRMLRTQNSCFAQFIQQISSVSTEKFQAGVKSSVKGRKRENQPRKSLQQKKTWWTKKYWCEEFAQRKKSRLWRSSQQKKMSSYWRMWNRKWILWCKLQGVMIQHLETDCENVFRDMKHWRKKSTSMEMSFKTIADVDDGFGDRTPACREYTHFFANIKIPESMRRFQNKL